MNCLKRYNSMVVNPRTQQFHWGCRKNGSNKLKKSTFVRRPMRTAMQSPHELATAYDRGKLLHLNGRHLSALYEIVDGWNRNPQVLGRLFYGKQIVNWSFAHSFGRRFDCQIILNIISIMRIGAQILNEKSSFLAPRRPTRMGNRLLSQDRHRKTGCVATL